MSKFVKPLITSIFIIAAVAIVFIIKPKQGIEPTNHYSTPSSLPPTTSLFFAGDIMLSRNVHRAMSEANDFTLPFRKVGDIIKNADIAFANLESPFNDTGRHFIDGSLVFNADPKSVEGLKFAGFDILSTANNHTMDQGTKGLNFTIDTLFNNGIIPSGTSKTTGEQILPVVEKNNILFGFLSYSYTALNDGGKSTSPYIKDFNDLPGLKQDVLGLKGHNSDVVIVSMHAGTEYTREPTQAQIDFAHAAIDAGADLVIGHHPHWIQITEQYKGKWIFYSLGNFVFDQMWSTDTKEGLTVLVTYKTEHIPDPTRQTAGESKIEIKKIEIKPVIIEDYCCPRWADSAETSAILNKLGLTNTILLDNN
jgi:poly-gamma-glutamate synthesis protein (capsule biosynthesis protein)